MTSGPLISPHPLDFDWRFDESTVDRISNIVHGYNIIALGVPSVANEIERRGRKVLLVDRRPEQSVGNHLVAEIPFLNIAPGSFDTAIVDAPWYPNDLIEWASLAAHAVGLRGNVFVSVWPPETRPRAADELDHVMEELGKWSDISQLSEEIGYSVPLFELIAISSSQNGILAKSPRRGRLIRLTIRSLPKNFCAPERTMLWHRFILDNYQLAVRLGLEAPSDVRIIPHPHAVNWCWPYVSARAPGRNKIGLWSSSGEVAQINDSAKIIAVLRAAFKSQTLRQFEARISVVPELNNWGIPRPPYKRLVEWQHL